MSKKQGLYGIKAFLVIVASGVVAGLLVVWIVASGIKAFVRTASEGISSSSVESVGPPPTRGPVSSLEAGSFDLCRDLEDMQAFNSVYQGRLDDGGNFVDTALDDPDREVREISNECSWRIVVGGLVESEVTLSYKSLVGVPPVELGDVLNEVENLVEEVKEEGELEGLPGGSRYLYGISGGDEIFVFVGVVKNSSFYFVFRNSVAREESLLVEYRTLVRKLLPEIRETLDRVVPD